MSHTIDRDHYRRSGRVAWARLLPALLLPLAVALFMGWVMFWIFDANWYYRMIVPAVACLPVVGFMYLAIGLGHCRNVWVAGALGAVVGAVCYLELYHARFASEEGAAAYWRLGELPGFIADCMTSDIEVRVGPRHPEGKVRQRASGKATRQRGCRVAWTAHRDIRLRDGRQGDDPAERSRRFRAVHDPR